MSSQIGIEKFLCRNSGIESFAPLSIINKRKPKKKKGKELSNEELRKILAPTVVYPPKPKKVQKWFRIANVVATSDEILSQLKRKQADDEEKKTKPKKKRTKKSQ